jgi:hypothetical protein
MFLLNSWMYLQLPVQSVSITTNVESSNPVHGEMYSIQYCVSQIEFTLDEKLEYNIIMQSLKFLHNFRHVHEL